MKRRQFLQSLAAFGAAPLVPSLASQAVAMGKVNAVSTAANANAYRWAEVIARAHKSSSLAMLQRHLKVDVTTAKVLQNQLIRNGVIGAQANAYGIYQATNPTFDGSFSKPADWIEKQQGEIGEAQEETDRAEEHDRYEIPITALYNEADWTSQIAA